jgi:hypothetical protein
MGPRNVGIRSNGNLRLSLFRAAFGQYKPNVLLRGQAGQLSGSACLTPGSCLELLLRPGLSRYLTTVLAERRSADWRARRLPALTPAGELLRLLDLVISPRSHTGTRGALSVGDFSSQENCGLERSRYPGRSPADTGRCLERGDWQSSCLHWETIAPAGHPKVGSDNQLQLSPVGYSWA